MKIATISDIHGFWGSINYPEADVLIFAGDILRNYASDKKTDAGKQLVEIENLDAKLEQLLADNIYKHILVIPGNHDFAFEVLEADCRKRLKHGKLLLNSGIEIEGTKFYGSPNQPWFHNWAFNFSCGDPKYGGNPARAKAQAKACWALIPEDTKVLITHGPPKDILDRTVSGERVGCPELALRLWRLTQLELSIFGHIHHSYGTTMKKINDKIVTFVNAAACNEAYQPLNPIQVIDI